MPANDLSLVVRVFYLSVTARASVAHKHSLIIGMVLFVALNFCVEGQAEQMDTSPPVIFDSQIEIPSRLDAGAAIRLLKLDADDLGLKIRGTVQLSSLAPPAGKVVLKNLEGDPRRIVKFLSGWGLWTGELPLRRDINRVSVRDLVLEFDNKRIDMKASGIEWPGGRVGPLALSTQDQLNWDLSVAHVTLERLPVEQSELPNLTELKITDLRVVDSPDRLELGIGQLAILGSRVHDLVFELNRPESDGSVASWAAKGGIARIKLQDIWNVVNRWPEARRYISRIKDEQDMEEIQISGEMEIPSLALRGEMLPGDATAWRVHEGDVGLTVRDASFILRPTHAPQASHQLFIPKASTRLHLENSQIEIDPLHIDASDNRGGTLGVHGRLRWPPELRGVDLNLTARDVSWSEYRISGKLGWSPHTQTPLELDATGANGLRLRARGRTQIWDRPDHPGVDIVLRFLTLTLPDETESPQSPNTDEMSTEPILPSGTPRPPFPIRIQADRVEVGDLPSLKRFLLQTSTLGGNGDKQQEPLRLGARGNWCEIDFDGEVAVDHAGGLSAQLQGRMRDTAFSNLMACGLAVSGQQAPPVYVEGRTTARFFMATQGQTLSGLQDNVMADASINLRDGRIMRLSNIDPRLGFILDILRLARLNPTQLRDTVSLDRLAIRARMVGHETVIDPISVRSPLLRVDGNVKVDVGVEPPVMELDLQVEAKGITKHLRTRKVLGSETETRN